MADSTVKRRRLEALEALQFSSSQPSTSAPQPQQGRGGRGQRGRGAQGNSWGGGGREGVSGRGQGRGGSGQGVAASVDAGTADRAAQLPVSRSDIEAVYRMLEELVKGSAKVPAGQQELRNMLEGKLRNKHVLLDNPHVSIQSASALRVAKKNQTGHASKLLSAKQRRALGVHRVPEEQCVFERFVPLTRLWDEYATKVISSNSNETAALKLCGLDYHGCVMTVVRSTCPSRVGLEGVVIKETAKTLLLVSKANCSHVVPKAGTHFAFAVAGRKFCLDGDRFPPMSARRPPQKERGQANAPRKLGSV